MKRLLLTVGLAFAAAALSGCSTPNELQKPLANQEVGVLSSLGETHFMIYQANRQTIDWDVVKFTRATDAHTTELQERIPIIHIDNTVAHALVPQLVQTGYIATVAADGITPIDAASLKTFAAAHALRYVVFVRPVELALPVNRDLPDTRLVSGIGIAFNQYYHVTDFYAAYQIGIWDAQSGKLLALQSFLQTQAAPGPVATPYWTVNDQRSPHLLLVSFRNWLNGQVLPMMLAQTERMMRK